jgi:acetyl-CoA C-acetyltransferase
MNEQKDPIVITAAVRTPLGRFQGELSLLAAPRLGAAVIRAAVERAQIDRAQVDEVLMGCVLPAGQGQAPARQAARRAGLPDATGATTVNKVCGSGMKAVMIGHDLLAAGSAELVVAGGMESMSNAPYLLSQARAGYRFGHGEIFDHAALDGLEDAYEKGRSMGTFGEDTAEAYQFTRDAQDAYAIDTLKRARAAIETGAFEAEVVPVAVAAKNGSVEISRDENPLKLSPEKIPTLKPAFRVGGTVTAASSSANADGAAAIVLTKRSTADRLGLPVLARIVAHASHAQEPRWFTTAPIPAIRKVLEKRIGACATSTCSRSTRRLRWCRWRPFATSGSTASA